MKTPLLTGRIFCASACFLIILLLTAMCLASCTGKDDDRESHRGGEGGIAFTEKDRETINDIAKSLRKIETRLEKLESSFENINKISKAFPVAATRRVSKSGHEAAIIATLRTISSTQEQYRARYGTYASLRNLSRSNFIDPVTGSGRKSGYIIRITASVNTWRVTAVPEKVGETGSRGFFVDQSGVLRYTTDGSRPSQRSPALD